MDLGSLPEWISALATLGAVVTALALLRRVDARARGVEATLATAAVERRRAITNHFLEILDHARNATDEALSAFNIEQADSIYYEHYARLQAAVRASERRIERLQSFSGLPIEIYLLSDRTGAVLTSPRISGTLDETTIAALTELQHQLRSIREDVVLAG